MQREEATTNGEVGTRRILGARALYWEMITQLYAGFDKEKV